MTSEATQGALFLSQCCHSALQTLSRDSQLAHFGGQGGSLKAQAHRRAARAADDTVGVANYLNDILTLNLGEGWLF